MTVAAVKLPEDEQASVAPALPAVFKLDNLLTEPARAQVDDFLRQGGWKFGHKSSAKRDGFSFWSKHFAGHRDEQTREYYDCAEELQKVSPLLFAFWTFLAGLCSKTARWCGVI
jgi:hypothetical protein